MAWQPIFYNVVPIDGVHKYYFITCLFAASLTVLGLQATDTYQVSALRTNITQLGKVLLVWTAVFATLALVAFFLRVSTDFSRIWYGSWYAGGSRFHHVPFNRFFNGQKWSRDGRLERRAVLVGGGSNAEELVRSLESQSSNDIRICGIFDDRSGDRSPPMVAGYPKLGTIEELVEFETRPHRYVDCIAPDYR